MRPLISADALSQQQRSELAPVVLDVRWRLLGPPARADYDQGHVPGAVFVDLESELAGSPGEQGRHPLPAPDHLQRVLRRAGVDHHRPVVVYDDADGSAAARAWWLLRWAGHQQVAVLDGGYAAWVALGLPVTAAEPEHSVGDFQVRQGSMPVLDADAAARLARQGHLLDARAPQRYRGEHEPVDPKAGHIPGALNAPFTEHVCGSGRWRTQRDLAEHFTRMGLAESASLGAYCGSGVTACSVLLALEHAGITSADRPAALYAGSWSQWSSGERPVATGGEPG